MTMDATENIEPVMKDVVADVELVGEGAAAGGQESCSS